MGTPLSYQHLKRKFNSFGLSVEKISGTHIWITGIVGGEERNFVLSIKHNRIDPVLIKKAHRMFQLTNEFGVSDQEFNSR